MSAVTAVYYRNADSVDPVVLTRMTDRLAHRGADGSGTWYDGSAGLGHRLLWTTPESLYERLPLVSDDGQRVLTADARIDNRDELIAAFNLTSSPERITDSELILRAYERWGERCTEYLIGDFAFALWDGEKGSLFCARDYMGVKPLYYYRSDTLVAVASEIKALFCLREIPRRLNETRVAHYVADFDDDREITLYEDILRLPAAHVMTVGRDYFRLNRYWYPDPKREIRFNCDAEYEKAFREVFDEAVRCRLRSAFPVGSTLSGGLDSSSVVCAARELRQREGAHLQKPSVSLHTFSAIFDDVPESDERDYINAVINQGDLDPHYVHPDQLSPFVDIDHMFWHFDECFTIINYSLDWAICNAARDAGVRVLLTGDDGDIVVSHGREYLVELLRKGRWSSFVHEVRAIADHEATSPLSILARNVPAAIVPNVVREGLGRLHQRWRNFNGDYGNMNSRFAQRIGWAEQIATLQRKRPRHPRTAREEHAQSIDWPFEQYVLEFFDKIAAAFSLELRHPFWDRRLVEFCLALPADQKLRSGWNRSIMRRALAGSLPPKLQWRGTKANLGPFFDRGLLKFEQKYLEGAIFKTPNCIEEFIDIAKLRRAYKLFLEGDTEESIFIWQSVALERWLSYGWSTSSAGCRETDSRPISMHGHH